MRNSHIIMRRHRSFAAALLAATMMTTPAAVMAKDAAAEEAKPLESAPVSDITKDVDIPYEKFTLSNGMTVIVHEDRKAPIVAVSVWYGVGSKHEPKGKTGYAHLFEHIMFNGSENAEGDYFTYLKAIGATDENGTTSQDRTNYFQTVPSNSIESALFLESDRMGNLLGAVTQDKLSNQIGVVQNEKRQGDNQPYGLTRYITNSVLYPEGHPYHHSTIGSMEDLSAASLDDMKMWFTDHYAPNNAVLVLAGDISAAEAKPLAEKWFGRFSAGKPLPEVVAPVPTLAEKRQVVIHDRVPNTRIHYVWAVPGLNDPDFVPLAAGGAVLGGLASSRLDNILVRDEKLAVQVSAFVAPYVHSSQFHVVVLVAPGQDADVVAKRLDEIMADFIANGPTQDEVDRVAMSDASGRVLGLEAVGGFGGKAVTLAEGELYSGSPDHYKKELDAVATVKPATIQGSMQTWLSRPVLEIRTVPGDRNPAEVEEFFGAVTKVSPPDSAKAAAEAAPAAVERPATDDPLATFPTPGAAAKLDLPTVETGKLKNGAKVHVATRKGLPVVRITVRFDGGFASDGAAPGTANFATRVMQEGTTTRNSKRLAEDQERLGASISGGSSSEETDFGVVAMKANLKPSVQLLADVVQNPAFAEPEIERVRVQQLSQIKGEMNQPAGIAYRLMPSLLFGEGHPYASPMTGTGSPDVVAKLDKAALTGFHQRWIRPDNMTIFVVGDVTMKDIMPVLNDSFGKWKAPKGVAKGTVAANAAVPTPTGRIVVVNRPNSPQSFIMAGQILPVKGTDELTPLYAANEILGGDFLSRINMDLRETKGWSYGTRTMLVRQKGGVPFIAYAPVQADKTGPSLLAMQGQMTDFLGDKNVTQEERDRVVNGAIMELPGSYEASSAVLGQMQNDAKFGRPFDYAEGTAGRYSALTKEDLDAALRGVVNPNQLVWIIVGDAEVIRPQLEGIGMPVEYRESE